jgi:hypothetical protein
VTIAPRIARERVLVPERRFAYEPHREFRR